MESMIFQFCFRRIGNSSTGFKFIENERIKSCGRKRWIMESGKFGETIVFFLSKKSCLHSFSKYYFFLFSYFVKKYFDSQADLRFSI